MRRQVTIEEGGVFRITREWYEEGEDIMDVLRRVKAWKAECQGYSHPKLSVTEGRTML